MTLTTTTIGAFPKPKETPIQDWFLSAKSEEERKASKGLLANWSPGAYEKAIKEAGDNVENLFLNSITNGDDLLLFELRECSSSRKKAFPINRLRFNSPFNVIF